MWLTFSRPLLRRSLSQSPRVTPCHDRSTDRGAREFATCSIRARSAINRAAPRRSHYYYGRPPAAPPDHNRNNGVRVRVVRPSAAAFGALPPRRFSKVARSLLTDTDRVHLYLSRADKRALTVRPIAAPLPPSARPVGPCPRPRRSAEFVGAFERLPRVSAPICRR
uniref:Uncharacterized protein n=1 Tax=Plectus sambesii TaxID=2011161 RepID=A0A914WDA0_9BILA